MPLTGIRHHALLVGATCWIATAIALVAHAPPDDAVSWLLGASIACMAAFAAHAPLSRRLRRRGTTLARALAPAPLVLAPGAVGALLWFDAAPAAVGWVLVAIACVVGFCLEACLPQHQREHQRRP